MTPPRLSACLTVLCWSQRLLARQLNRDEAQIRRWARGDAQIPEYIAIWLERRVQAAEKFPAPRRVK